jgi:hypothetical protein
MVVTQRTKLGNLPNAFHKHYHIKTNLLSFTFQFKISEMMHITKQCVTCTQNNNTHALHIINKGHKHVIKRSVSAQCLFFASRSINGS